MMNVLITKLPTRIISKRCFRRDRLGQYWGFPNNMNRLARAARVPMMEIDSIRMVKFLMTRARRKKLCTDGHLIIVDIPSTVSQSDQAAFPGWPYSQEGSRDQGRMIVSDRLRTGGGGAHL